MAREALARLKAPRSGPAGPTPASPAPGCDAKSSSAGTRITLVDGDRAPRSAPRSSSTCLQFSCARMTQAWRVGRIPDFPEQCVGKDGL